MKLFINYYVDHSVKATYCVEAESKEALANAFTKGFNEWADRLRVHDKLYAECQPLYAKPGSVEYARWQEFRDSGDLAKTMRMEVLGYQFDTMYDCTDENGDYCIKYFPDIFTVEEWIEFVTPMMVE